MNVSDASEMPSSAMSVPSLPARRANPAHLALDYIMLDDRLQSRLLRPGVVKAYHEILRRGEELPPVRVVRDLNGNHYLVDGHHTVAANRQRVGMDSIAVEIVDGTFDDALWLSWGANRNHGLQRTQKDTRRAIQAAVQHPRWSLQSDRAIAQHIGCDHKTVGAIRRKCAPGEFPTDRSRPSKRQLLQACRLLAQAQPTQAHQFGAAELATMTAGYESLQRLLCRTTNGELDETQGGCLPRS
jgi:hypothetical protein